MKNSGVFVSLLLCSCIAVALSNNLRGPNEAVQDQQQQSQAASLITRQGEWFELNSRGGKWNIQEKNGISTIVRYDMHDVAECQLSASMATIGTKNVDSASVDFTLSDDAILTLDVKGFVSQQQHQTSIFEDRNNNDVLNVYVDGHWIYQATGKDRHDDAENKDVCSMGEYNIGRAIPDNGVHLSKGVRYFTVEVISNAASFHQGGYYEVEFVLLPLSNFIGQGIVHETIRSVD